jgi:hypothetical protein
LYDCRHHKTGDSRPTSSTTVEEIHLLRGFLQSTAPEIHAKHDGFPADFSRF